MQNYNLIMIDLLEKVTLFDIKLLAKKIDSGHESFDIEVRADAF